MASRRRWILGGVGAVALVGLTALGIVGGALYSAFGSNLPLEEGLRVGEAVTAVDGFVSCYAVPAPGAGALVVDTCTDGTALDPALAELGLSRQDVTAVLLTHGHSDHAGGVSRFPNAWVFAHESEVPLLAGEATYQGLVTKRSGPTDPPIEVSIPVKDGKKVRVGELECRAIHLPGHTPGNLAWLVGDTLFMGDSGSAHTDGTISPPPGFFSDDPDAAAASLAGLRDKLDQEGLVVEHLAFAHSGPLEADALPIP